MDKLTKAAEIIGVVIYFVAITWLLVLLPLGVV